MERKIYSLIIIVSLFFVEVTASGNKTGIYSAFISGNMAEWKIIIDNMHNQKDKNLDFILELLNYQYGYIGWCISNKKYDEAEKYIEQGQTNIDILRKKNYQLSMVNAYEAAFYGFRIGINKFKAPFYGPKSIDHSNTAIKLDNKNPYGYILLGNSQFHAPEAFGGSKTLALENFTKAAKLFESNKENTINNWNYLALLAQIALTYEKTGQIGKAKTCYETILKTEPGFAWVRDELYPALLKKMS